MRIHAFDVEERELGALSQLCDQHQFSHCAEALTAASADRLVDAEVVSLFIHSRVDRELLARLPGLRLLATRSTGYDHIDLAACRERGIAVCNVPNYGERTVAEHVFAMLLALSHRIVEAAARTRNGLFTPEGLEGFDLCGRTLGVIGTGSIGRHVIRIARGFDMRVLAQDLAPDPALAAREGFSYVSLPELLAVSDVVSLHVPATNATDNLLGEAELAQIKPGAVLINTARGQLVDLRALIRALRSGRIAAAGLDVLPGEPMIREEAELISNSAPMPQALATLVAEHVLLHMPNVLVTPHSAFNTREAVQRIVETTVANIRAYAAGAPQNLVGNLGAQSGT